MECASWKLLFNQFCFSCVILLTFAHYPVNLILLQTNVLFRHGDRAPISPVYKNDMNSESKWKYGFDELTDVGRGQHYRLGKFLRSKYRDFVKDYLDVKEVYVRSSDIDRCLVSAYSHLAGFFSNSTQEDDLDLPFMRWQLVPVHSVPKLHDEVLAMDRPCKAARAEVERALHRGITQRVNEEFVDFFAWLVGVTGENITDAASTWQVSDTSFCEKTHDLSLPDWLDRRNVTCGSHSPIPCEGQSVFEILYSMLDLSFQSQYNSTKLHMFYGGPLLQEIKTNFHRIVHKAKINETTPKYHIFSAHDSTVAATLSALNIYHPIAPQYTATLLFELHSTDDGEVVKLFYKPYTDNETVTPLTVPGCVSPCTLKTFTEIVERLRIDDWDTECGNTDLPLNQNFRVTHQEFVTILACSTGVLVLSLLTLLCFIRRRRISHRYMPINSAP